MLEIKKTNAKQLQTKKKHLDVKYVDSGQAKEKGGKNVGFRVNGGDIYIHTYNSELH